MHVFVDNREHKRLDEILEYYQEEEDDVTCEVLTLDTGDFIFDDGRNQVCFEWKTIADFIASVKDKRVFNQSISMYDEFDYHFVIIVGTDIELENSLVIDGLRPSAYYGAITRLNTYTTVITAPDNHTAYALMLCQAHKCLDDTFVYKRLPIKSPNPAQNLLLTCNKIGEETVKLLTNELNLYSFKDLTRLSYDDLISIQGIGPKTANMILEYIGETIT